MRPEIIADKIMTHPITGKAINSRELFAMLATAIGDIKGDDWFNQSKDLSNVITAAGPVIYHPEDSRNGFYDGMITGCSMQNHLFNTSLNAEDAIINTWSPVGGALTVGGSSLNTNNHRCKGVTVTGNGSLPGIGFSQMVSVKCTPGKKFYISAFPKADKTIASTMEIVIGCTGKADTRTIISKIVEPTNPDYRLSEFFTVPAGWSGYMTVLIRNTYESAAASNTKQFGLRGAIVVNTQLTPIPQTDTSMYDSIIPTPFNGLMWTKISEIWNMGQNMITEPFTIGGIDPADGSILEESTAAIITPESVPCIDSTKYTMTIDTPITAGTIYFYNRYDEYLGLKIDITGPTTSYTFTTPKYCEYMMLSLMGVTETVKVVINRGGSQTCDFDYAPFFQTSWVGEFASLPNMTQDHLNVTDRVNSTRVGKYKIKSTDVQLLSTSGVNTDLYYLPLASLVDDLDTETLSPSQTAVTNLIMCAFGEETCANDKDALMSLDNWYLAKSDFEPTMSCGVGVCFVVPKDHMLSEIRAKLTDTYILYPRSYNSERDDRLNIDISLPIYSGGAMYTGYQYHDVDFAVGPIFKYRAAMNTLGESTTIHKKVSDLEIRHKEPEEIFYEGLCVDVKDEEYDPITELYLRVYYTRPDGTIAVISELSGYDETAKRYLRKKYYYFAEDGITAKKNRTVSLQYKSNGVITEIPY